MPCKGCIVVVDDDPDVREALASRFEALGCSVVRAGDGLEALDRLERCPTPCLVLLDVNMPRLDGGGLARLVRGDRRHCKLPIVSMSAGRDRLAAPLIDSHLEKPFDFDVLAPSIERSCRDPDWLHGAR